MLIFDKMTPPCHFQLSSISFVCTDLQGDLVFLFLIAYISFALKNEKIGMFEDMVNIRSYQERA